MKKKWTQKATNPELEGAFRRDVKARYGKKGFTKSGSIKKSVLTELSRDKNKRTDKTTKVARRARFALNARKRRK